MLSPLSASNPVNTEEIARLVAESVRKNRSVTLELAERLVGEVMKEAERIGVKSVCAVCDDGGNPKLVKCADGSFLASYDIALGKAYTAVSLKMTTKELSRLACPGGPLYGIQNTNGGRIVIFGGGVPLTVGECVVGGFGVSGGTEEQDTYLGEYALGVFSRLAEI